MVGDWDMSYAATCLASGTPEKNMAWQDHVGEVYYEPGQGLLQKLYQKHWFLKHLCTEISAQICSSNSNSSHFITLFCMLALWGKLVQLQHLAPANGKRTGLKYHHDEMTWVKSIWNPGFPLEDVATAWSPSCCDMLWIRDRFWPNVCGFAAKSWTSRVWSAVVLDWSNKSGTPAGPSTLGRPGLCVMCAFWRLYLVTNLPAGPTSRHDEEHGRIL